MFLPLVNYKFENINMQILDEYILLHENKKYIIRSYPDKITINNVITRYIENIRYKRHNNDYLLLVYYDVTINRSCLDMINLNYLTCDTYIFEEDFNNIDLIIDIIFFDSVVYVMGSILHIDCISQDFLILCSITQNNNILKKKSMTKINNQTIMGIRDNTFYTVTYKQTSIKNTVYFSIMSNSNKMKYQFDLKNYLSMYFHENKKKYYYYYSEYNVELIFNKNFYAIIEYDIFEEEEKNNCKHLLFISQIDVITGTLKPPVIMVKDSKKYLVYVIDNELFLEYYTNKINMVILESKNTELQSMCISSMITEFANSQDISIFNNVPNKLKNETILLHIDSFWNKQILYVDKRFKTL